MHRIGATRADLVLDPAREAAARDLASLETAYCSSFTFDFVSGEDTLTLTVSVPAAHAPVLEVLVATAERDAGLGSKADAA